MMRVMMTNGEMVLGTAIVFLSIALTIVSLKLYKHERNFTSIQTLFTMVGHKLHAIDHALDIEHDHKETKKNVKV
jgi:hypothetical protein